MVFRWILHLRGSLSRVRDELKEHGIEVALTTVMRWLKKAGEECVNTLGTIVTDLPEVNLFYHKDKQAMRTFLYMLKALGFRPKSITTDLLMCYEAVVNEVFPDCIYHQCVMHAGRDAKRIVKIALPNKGDEEWKKRLG